MEHAARRILHANVTAHPTAPWTIQQLREALSSDHGHRFLIHDRDSIFSQQLDQQVWHLGLRVLKTLGRSPQANALAREVKRFAGTVLIRPPAENGLLQASVALVFQWRAIDRRCAQERLDSVGETVLHAMLAELDKLTGRTE